MTREMRISMGLSYPESTWLDETGECTETSGTRTGRTEWPLSRIPPMQGILGLRRRWNDGRDWFDVFACVVGKLVFQLETFRTETESRLVEHPDTRPSIFGLVV